MRILVTGASGNLGAYLIERSLAIGHTPIAWSRSETGERSGLPLRPVDLTDQAATERALREADPAVVLHAAAISLADAAWREPTLAWAVNTVATRFLADWCDRRGRRMIFTSTDLVFDGTQPWRREDDPAEPILEYGRTKRAAELAVLAVPGGLVARVSLLYGRSRCGRAAFFDQAIDALRRGEPRTFFRDEFRTPLPLATAAHVLIRLAETDATGIVHVGGTERVSRHELMSRAAAVYGIDAALVRSNLRSDAPLPEPRPADVSLETSRLAALLPDLARPTIEAALVAEVA